MDFGIPTFIGKTLEECAAHCQQLGLRFVEVSMDFPEYQPERINVDRFAEIAEKYGIYYTLRLEGALNPWEINDRAAAYTETVLDTVDIAKKLSIPIEYALSSGRLYHASGQKGLFVRAIPRGVQAQADRFPRSE